MGEKDKAKKILKVLNKIYPTTPIPLDHTSNFTLLMSVLLSAQCTDLNVNNVTKNIYPKYNKPEHFRPFVLIPLGDVSPKWKHPILNKTSQEMLNELAPELSIGISCFA